jgi:hypothetical protein
MVARSATLLDTTISLIDCSLLVSKEFVGVTQDKRTRAERSEQLSRAVPSPWNLSACSPYGSANQYRTIAARAAKTTAQFPESSRKAEERKRTEPISIGAYAAQAAVARRNCSIG